LLPLPETQRRLPHMIIERYDPVNLFELVPTKLCAWRWNPS
jgi:hypothetical protein